MFGAFSFPALRQKWEGATHTARAGGVVYRQALGESWL